jgi:hypothetical protein
VTSLFVNPALLMGAGRVESAFSQAKTSQDEMELQVSAAFGVVKGRLAVGFAWDARLSRDQQQTEWVRDGNGQVQVDPLTGLPMERLVGFFDRDENVFRAGLAGAVGPLALGAGGAYHHIQFGGRKAEGLGVDAGAVLRLGGGCVGGVLRDVGDTKLRDRGGEGRDGTQRASFSGGVWWREGLTRDIALGFGGGAKGTIDRGDRWGISGGWEASYRDGLFVRWGVNRDRMALGVGVVAHPSKGFKEVRVDYAYLARVGEGVPSRLTLSVAW